MEARAMRSRSSTAASEVRYIRRRAALAKTLGLVQPRDHEEGSQLFALGVDHV